MDLRNFRYAVCSFSV